MIMFSNLSCPGLHHATHDPLPIASDDVALGPNLLLLEFVSPKACDANFDTRLVADALPLAVDGPQLSAIGIGAGIESTVGK